MSSGQQRQRLRWGSYILKHVGRFPDLKYDGTNVKCCVCEVRLLSLNLFTWQKHLKSLRHQRNKAQEFPYAMFVCDLIFMFSVCNIPLWVLDKEPFRQFWKKFTPHWPLPSRRTASRKLPRFKQLIINRLKQELKNKKIWLTVDKMTDAKGNNVANVLVRILKLDGVSSPYLLACKRLKTVNATTIQQLLTKTIETMGLDRSQVLMLVTDSTECMVEAGQLLKVMYPNLLHVTCMVDALNKITEEIRDNYPAVDTLISRTRQIFVKGAKHTKNFRKACPDISVPPQPISSCWITWLEAAFYYRQHFQDVKNFVLQLNPGKSQAISESQQQFNDPEVEAGIQTIYNNYSIVVDSMRQLENTSSLAESLSTLDNVQNILQTLEDPSGKRVWKRCSDVLQENPGYTKLCFINRCLTEKRDPDELHPFFKFAKITAVDVQNSFSLYTSLLTQQKRYLTEGTIETLLLMQMFSRGFPKFSPEPSLQSMLSSIQQT